MSHLINFIIVFINALILDHFSPEKEDVIIIVSVILFVFMELKDEIRKLK